MSIQIPSNCVGRVGMVAMLQKVAPEQEGRLVTLRYPVGFVSSLGSGDRPVFAWEVIVMGEAIEINGKPRRNIIVADRCLKPVSEVEAGSVEDMSKAQAQRDFDEAMAELVSMIKTMNITPDDLEGLVDKAANQFGIGHALEVVPIANALRGLDFRPASPDSDAVLHWSGIHEGVQLYVFGGADMFGHWTITGRCNSQREAMWQQQVLRDEEERGKVALTVLELWRSAFGKNATVPECLEIGLLYERHLQDIRRLEIGLPALQLDGEIFRATRRWISQRHWINERLVGPMVDRSVSLSFEDGLLKLRLDDQIYACPATGIWIEDCCISLQRLLAIPYWAVRGNRVVLEQSVGGLSFNQVHVALV